jgi:hypothetical protein
MEKLNYVQVKMQNIKIARMKSDLIWKNTRKYK